MLTLDNFEEKNPQVSRPKKGAKTYCVMPCTGLTQQVLGSKLLYIKWVRISRPSDTLGEKDIDSPESPLLHSIPSHLPIPKAQPRPPPLCQPRIAGLGFAQRLALGCDGSQAEASAVGPCGVLCAWQVGGTCCLGSHGTPSNHQCHLQAWAWGHALSGPAHSPVVGQLGRV